MTRSKTKPALGMGRTAALAAALGLGIFLSLPQPAKADSFFFGYSSGGWHRPYRGAYFGPWYRPYFRPRYYGPRVIFFGPPVVIPPPVVYTAPPRPIYVPAPVVKQPIRVNPASAPYRAANGLTCREYQTTATVAGRTQNVYGTACLQPDGAWRIVD